MSLPGCAVIERSGGWLLVVGDETEELAADVEPSELAVCADLMTKLAGMKNPSCVLAPDSTSCFFAKLSPDDDIDVRDRAALAYEFEDHLPIDAESMVADFTVVPSGQPQKQVAAIAVPIDRWHAIAEALESVGIPVRSIVPRAVLAARALVESGELADDAELLLVEGDQCDAITLRSRTLAAWKHFRVDRSQLRRYKLLDSTEEAGEVVVAGADLNPRSIILDAYPRARLNGENASDLAVRGAALLIHHPSSRWFNLRRDALGPSDPLRAIQSQLRLLGLAVAACLLALAVGGWWRTHRIESQITTVQAKQQQLFREAFPGSRVPGAILRRVRSEHAKVLGSRGETSEVDVPVSATMVLRELLGALPSEVRFRITHIKIADGQVDLDLQVRNPVDAGALATSLSSAGFDVKPPGTTLKDARTFESLLEATWTARTLADDPKATGQTETQDQSRTRQPESTLSIHARIGGPIG